MGRALSVIVAQRNLLETQINTKLDSLTNEQFITTHPLDVSHENFFHPPHIIPKPEIVEISHSYPSAKLFVSHNYITCNKGSTISHYTNLVKPNLSECDI